MHKKFLVIAIILLSLANTTIAKDIIIKVTPAETITTSKKNSISEGDYVNFKVVEDTKILKKGDCVTGLVTSVENNGFAGKEAMVLIENFRSKDKIIQGEIYLHGNVHKKLNDFVDVTCSDFFVLMRGGEIIVKPNEQEFILYIEEK